MKNKKNIMYDIIIFLAVFIPLLVVLYIYWPGILTSDSYDQLNQIHLGDFYNWHPFFHTFIEMLCLKIWNTPGSIAFFQVLVLSFLWTIICRYTRKDNNFKFLLFQVFITLLMSLNPMNSINAITLWKDTLFCYSILGVTFIIHILIDKGYKIKFSLCIWLAISLALMASIRYNGMYILYVLIIPLIIILFKKDKKSKNYLKLPILVIVFVGIINSLNIIYKVKDNQKSATDSKVMQLMAYYIKEDKLDDKDIAVIEKFVDPQALADAYNPYFSDPIYMVINGTNIKDYISDIYVMLFKYSFKNPDLLLNYAFKSTSIVWRIDRPKDSIGGVLNTNIFSTNNPGILPLNYNKNIYNNIVSIILYSPALYFYMTVIIVLIIYRHTKELKKWLFLLLPNFLNMVIIALSVPIQDVRYVYSNFLIFYFLCILLGSNLFMEKREKNEKK